MFNFKTCNHKHKNKLNHLKLHIHVQWEIHIVKEGQIYTGLDFQKSQVLWCNTLYFRMMYESRFYILLRQNRYTA